VAESLAGEGERSLIRRVFHGRIGG
jgi:hypothetical protein